MLYSYVPSLVKCKVFGVELVGLSKESIVTIERMENVNSFRKAQDGSSVAFVDNYGSYRVTFNIEQVSESNEFLHTIFKLHQRAGLNLKIPISVEEDTRYGGTQFNAFECFFETEPTTEFTSMSGTSQWVFVCHDASYYLKGTSDSSRITEALRATIRLIEYSESLGIDLSTVERMIDVGIDAAQKKLKELF